MQQHRWDMSHRIICPIYSDHLPSVCKNRISCNAMNNIEYKPLRHIVHAGLVLIHHFPLSLLFHNHCCLPVHICGYHLQALLTLPWVPYTSVFPRLSPSIFPAFATRDNIYDAYTAATQDLIIIMWGGCIIATVAPLSCWLNGVAMQPLSPHHPITGHLGTWHAWQHAFSDNCILVAFYFWAPCTSKNWGCVSLLLPQALRILVMPLNGIISLVSL